MRLAALALLLVAFFACKAPAGDAAPAPAAPPASQPAPRGDLERLLAAAVTELCACADPACAEDSDRKVRELLDRYHLSAAERTELRSSPLFQRADACATRLRPEVQRMHAILVVAADALCACRDLACADAVQAKVRQAIIEQHLPSDLWGQVMESDPLGRKIEECGGRLKR